MKKISLFGVIAITFAITLSFQANAEEVNCPVLESGDLFKIPNNSAVYYVDDNLNRLYFPNSEIFHSWFEDFSTTVEISSVCVDNYPAPKEPPYGVNYRPGAKLVKVQISPSVYVVEPGNKLAKIKNEGIAKELYGPNWANLVRDVADAFWPNYNERGEDLNEAKPHDGMFVKTPNSSDVYYVEKGEMVKVDEKPTEDVRTIGNGVFAKLVVRSGIIETEAVYANPVQKERNENAATPAIPTDTASSTPTIPAVPSNDVTSTGAIPAVPATPANPTTNPTTPALPATPAVPNNQTDTTAPTISNIESSNITLTAATITWTTNELSDSKVSYSKYSMVLATTTTNVANSSDTTSHSLNISNLSSNTTYYFFVVSTDTSGNTATSSERTFTTLTPSPPIPTSYEERIVQITTNSTDQDRPAISGNKIVWSDNRNGTRDIFMYDLITNIETQISNGPGDEFDPHISGNRIVYRDTRLNPSNPNYTITNIYLYDLTSSISTIVGAGTQPRIDSNNIVYINFPYTPTRRTYLYNISTGQTTLISENGDSVPYISGNDIIYTALENLGGNGILYHYSLNSETERQIVSGNIPFQASVSNGIVAYTKRTGSGSTGYDIYIYNLSTNTEKKLTTKGGGELSNISISGNRVVWTDTDNYNIYLYDLSTDQLNQLTSNSSQQYHSYVDGNRVVWADYRNGNFDIYLLEL